MNDLFSSSLQQRLSASRLFEVFGSPVRFTGTEEESWSQLRGGTLAGGDPWPEDLKNRTKDWPPHAFGTANAAVLILWHRPGMGAGGSEPGDYLGPPVPNLGGIPHLHVKEWPRRHPDPSWNNLVKFVAEGFRALGVMDPWPHVMIACLNPEPGRTGNVDHVANLKAVEAEGRLDQIVEATRPIVMLACGGEVHRALAAWSPRVAVAVTPVSHPLHWGSFAGSHHGPEVSQRLAQALRSNGASK